MHFNTLKWCILTTVDEHTITKHKLPGEIAELICLDAEYICLTKGIRFINHSPIKNTVEPNHDEAKIPTKKIKIIDVMNPRPAPDTKENQT